MPFKNPQDNKRMTKNNQNKKTISRLKQRQKEWLDRWLFGALITLMIIMGALFLSHPNSSTPSGNNTLIRR
mgnify:CR=1 FL=1